MSNEHGNANKRLLGEEVIQSTEEEGEAGTPLGLSSNFLDGTNHRNSDLDNTPRPMSLSMLQRPHAISGSSNAEFLPSTPAHGTPNSAVAATMELLPLHHRGQDINPVPPNQLNTINPQQNVIHNEQFHQPPYMNMVNAGVSQTPSNQIVQNMRNPYSHPPPADYGFQIPSRSQVPIGNMPPALVEQLVHMQRGYQQMANNPSFPPFRPQQAPPHAGAYATGGPPYHRFLMPNMPNPQMKAVPKDQPFNWLPQGLGNQNQEPNHPSTSNSRCMNSLYDPAFEEMGLPIDPHLRMFLASTNQDKATSNETNRSK